MIRMPAFIEINCLIKDVNRKAILKAIPLTVQSQWYSIGL